MDFPLDVVRKVAEVSMDNLALFVEDNADIVEEVMAAVEAYMLLQDLDFPIGRYLLAFHSR